MRSYFVSHARHTSIQKHLWAKMSSSSQYVVNFFPFCKIKRSTLDFFSNKCPFWSEISVEGIFFGNDLSKWKQWDYRWGWRSLLAHTELIVVIQGDIHIKIWLSRDFSHDWNRRAVLYQWERCLAFLRIFFRGMISGLHKRKNGNKLAVIAKIYLRSKTN